MPDPNFYSQEPAWPSADVRAEMGISDPPSTPGTPPAEPTYQPPSPQSRSADDAAAAAAAEDRAILERMKSRNFNVGDFKSDDDFLTAFEEGYSYVESRSRELDEYERDRENYLNWKSSQGQTPAQPQQTSPPTPAADDPPAWNPPAVSEQAMLFARNGSISVDPKTGRYRAVDPSLAKYEKELNDQIDFQAQNARAFIRDPAEFLERAGVKKRWEKEFREAYGLPESFDDFREQTIQAFQQQQQQLTQRQVLQKQVQDLTPDLYQVGSDGRVLYNAAGQPLQTELGNAFLTLVNNPPSYISDSEEARVQYALDQIRPYVDRTRQQAPPGTPAPANGQPAPPAQPQTNGQRKQQKQQTFLENARSRRGKPGERIPAEDTNFVAQAARSSMDDLPQGRRAEDELWARNRQIALDNDFA